MHIRKLLLAATVLAATALSACGSDNNGGSSATTPLVVPAPKQEDSFGAMFGVDYRAAALTEPAAAVDGDIIPVSLTTEPVAVS